MAIDIEWFVDFFLRQARLAFEEGDYTRTRNSCREVLEYRPQELEAWSLLGEAALASQDSVTALRAFENLVELEPQQLEHLLKLGQACIQVQNWDGALAAYNQVLMLEPDHAGALETLGLIEQLQVRLNVLSHAPEQVLGRNEACLCGSGLKYKKCCLEKSSQRVIAQRLSEAYAAENWSQVVDNAAELSLLTDQQRYYLVWALYQLTYRDKAYELLPAVVAMQPDDLELRAAQADLELDHDEVKAQRLAESVLAQDPAHWRASLVLAAVYSRRKQPALAEKTLRALLEHNPECDMAWRRLSHFLRSAGRLGDDLEAMSLWTQRCPRNADAWCHLGMAAVMNGHPLIAREYLIKALEIKPEHHEALAWIGQSYKAENDPNQALGYLLRSLEIKSDYQPAWNILGEVYRSVGRHHESEGCFMRAVAISTTQPLAWNNLANTYLDGHVLDEAENVARVAIELCADEPGLWSTLGNILSAAQRLSEALQAYRTAQEVRPDFEPVKINLAGVESSFGNLDRAIELLKDAIHQPGAATNLFFTANYHPTWTGKQLFELYKEVTQNYPARKYFDYANDKAAARPLRIGYVSPDFRAHVCAMFIEPLLEHHNKSQVEVFCYSLVVREDFVTERLMGYVDHWRHCAGQADELIAEQIRADQIDILVDVAGHTGNNGLKIFALKPAPVQVSWWMGFAFGTGLSQVDYFLSDEQMLPEGCESSFAEQLWRMPAPAIAYVPPVLMQVPVTELPALKNGYVTFGSLTRPIRLNDRVIRVWSQLLLRVANSRLMLDSAFFKDQSLCEHVRNKFAEYGIAAERLLIGHTALATDALSSMDIALDCFPHNSGTTLYESLYQGLPVVTLRDRPSMGRVGALILHGAGFDEWISDTEEQYLEKLVELASDLPALAHIRQGLRQRMLDSKLCDAPDFAQRIEQTYQQMWQRYCDQGEA